MTATRRYDAITLLLYGLLVAIVNHALNGAVSRIADELDQAGFVCLEDLVPQEWLVAAATNAESLLAVSGDFDHTIYGIGDDENSPAHSIVADPALGALFRDLTLARCPRGIVEGQGIHSVLRILVGSGPKDDPLWFHYDASVVTMIIPIIIPESGAGASGELILYPNRRPFRRFVASNIVEKLLSQNRYYRRWVARRFERDPSKHMVHLRPGNAYLFWGYRTYHAHLPCPPGKRRVTLCLHFGNPHGRHPALAAAAVVRNFWRKFRGTAVRRPASIRRADFGRRNIA